ncbi:MAG: PAS domain S-box protein [candidate division Zixibacteria bacterium]|nr:PAS domain S-box protein [candidate division Zixibacteria bacterium]
MRLDKHANIMGWFLPLRLAQFVILFTVVVFWMNYPRFMQVQFVLYSICTLAFTILLAIDKRGRFKNATIAVIGLQFLFEIILESSIIYSTGNINSPFSALFILTIVSAALVYRLMGTMILASLVSASYALIIWLGIGSGVVPELSMNALRRVYSSSDRVFYSIFLHILIFYLVAFISGYLAERIKQRDQELKDTSLALKKAKLETDDILRHLNSGLLTVDTNGRIIYFNRAAERILGYREEDVTGMYCREVFAERMPSLARNLMDGVDNSIAHPRSEIETLDIDGHKVPLGLATSVLRDGDGMRGIIAIFSDLTEAKLLEAKVRFADRLAAVGELSASIAHEIRNPLAAISGSVEVLKGDLKVDGENERLMNLIVKESDRLTNLLNEFLTYARIDRPAYNKVELLHLVTETLEILHHHPSFHDQIRVQIEADESIIYVVGDEGLIKQLLINLAVNACQALAGRAGCLRFRYVVNQEKGTVEMYVEDDGPGITPEHMKSIYKPFYSTKKEGTGLGLAIVHRICSALKLDITADSQVGEGTTFLVEFKTYQSDKQPLGDRQLNSTVA